jgi:hypothetical protein
MSGGAEPFHDAYLIGHPPSEDCAAFAINQAESNRARRPCNVSRLAYRCERV